MRHKSRTYAEACEELGGQPWRALEGTEQWFLADEPQVSTLERIERTVDTAAFRIGRRPLISRTVWFSLGALGLAVGFVLLLAPYAQIQSPAAPAPVVIVAQLPPAQVVAPVAAPPRAIVKQPPRRAKVVHRRSRRRR